MIVAAKEPLKQKMHSQRQDLIEKAWRRVQEYKQLQAAGLICQDGDFFPSVHYPPITMYPLMTEEEMFRNYTLPEDGLFDIYVHIPFCRKRCVFCHYPVQLGKQLAKKDRYLQALEKEMDLYMQHLEIQKIQA